MIQQNWLLTACLLAALAGFPVPGNTAAPPASPAAQPAVPAAPPAPPPGALIVATQPGALEAAQRAALFQPFSAATGVPVVTQPWTPTQAALKQALSAPHPPMVLLLPGDVAARGCADHSLEKLDFDKLGGKDHFLPQGMQDCGLGAVTTALALAWDRDKYHGSAPGWAEFWDVARVPGKRGLPQTPRGTLEIALMADGVAPGDVYRTLGTSDGVDRAFRKLDQLRPYIVWWNSPSEAVRILESGDVLLNAAPTGSIAVAVRGGKSLAVQWTNALSSELYWALPQAGAGAANPGAPGATQQGATRQDAQHFLAYAATTPAQASLQSAIPYGGLVKGANDDLPADIAEWSTGTPAHQQTMLATDEQFWRDNADKLGQRFADWLHK